MADNSPNTYEQGVLDERARISAKVREKGYDWSHDPNGTSGLQHLLNWIDGYGE